MHIFMKVWGEERLSYLSTYLHYIVFLSLSKIYFARHARSIAFLARDSMLSALYAIARPSVCPSVRLSVCLSVRHTGGSVKNG